MLIYIKTLKIADMCDEMIRVGVEMQEKYTFKDLAEEVLWISDTPLSPSEIWTIGQKRGFTKKLFSLGKTPIYTLSARIYTSIKGEEGKFVQVSKRPAKFCLKEQANNIKNSNQSSTQQLLTDIKAKVSPKERDLHKLLSTFVGSSPYFKCRTKTIFHEKSSKAKKGRNEWLHPDIVGVYYPFLEYMKETLSLYSVMGTSPYKLFSFEIKVSIDFHTLREYYFQAVSNSSWAHEGYLVGLTVDESSDFQEEIKRLNNSFGIGLIKLNPENIAQSEIILPAKTNAQLDFQTIDRLITENPDFKDFISDIHLDTKDSHPKLRGTYDDVFEGDEEAQLYCIKKGICTEVK